jgi:hypothetical protein
VKDLTDRRSSPAHDTAAAGIRGCRLIPSKEKTMSDILTRRQTHFVLWCPAQALNPPELIVGQIQNGNPPAFE